MMHQSSHHATTCGGEGENEKITVLLFQIFLPVKLVWKWDCGGDLRLLSWTAWTHVFSLLEKNKNKNTASGGCESPFSQGGSRQR